MKYALMPILTIFLIISTPAKSLDWGLGSMITTNINNIFSREPSKKDTSQLAQKKQEDSETLEDFISRAKFDGYVTKGGELDYDRISNNPNMVAKLNSIMNNIEPAAGPLKKHKKRHGIALKHKKMQGASILRVLK